MQTLPHRTRSSPYRMAALLALGAAILCVQQASAQVPQPIPAAPNAAEERPTITFTGELQAFKGENEFTILIDKTEMQSHVVSAETKITRNGKLAGFDELKKGDVLKVSTDAKNPTVAIEISAAEPPKTKSPKAGDPPTPAQVPVEVETRAEAAHADAPATVGLLIAPTPDRSVLVAGVAPGGPGAEAGIAIGDFVVSANKRTVAIKRPTELAASLPEVSPGEVVDVTIWRHGETRQFRLRAVPSGTLKDADEVDVVQTVTADRVVVPEEGASVTLNDLARQIELLRLEVERLNERLAVGAAAPARP